MLKSIAFCTFSSTILGFLTLWYGEIFYSGLYYLFCVYIGIVSSYILNISNFKMIALSVIFSIFSEVILSVIRLGYFGL